MSDNQLSLDGIPDEFMQGQIKVECPYLLQMVYQKIKPTWSDMGKRCFTGRSGEGMHSSGREQSPYCCIWRERFGENITFFWCCDRCKYILPRLYLLCRNQWIIMEQFIGL